MTVNPYAHHVPGAAAKKDMETLRKKFAELHSFIGGFPTSREQSLAFTHLQIAAMFANKAAVLADPESKAE